MVCLALALEQRCPGNRAVGSESLSGLPQVRWSAAKWMVADGVGEGFEAGLSAGNTQCSHVLPMNGDIREALFS